MLVPDSTGPAPPRQHVEIRRHSLEPKWLRSVVVVGVEWLIVLKE